MVLGLLTIPSLVSSSEQISGILGMKWGQSLETLDKLGFVDYMLTPTWPAFKSIKFGEIDDCSPQWEFYKDRFYQFWFIFGVWHYDDLKKLLTSKYGKPETTPIVYTLHPNVRAGECCKWNVGNVLIELQLIKGSAPSLKYTYKPILKEKERAESLGNKTKDVL